MKSDAPVREHLSHLSSLMSRAHKAMFQLQLQDHEKVHGRVEGAGNHLQLLLSAPDFQWLRILSQVMVMTDDFFFSKEPVPFEAYLSTKAEIEKLFYQDTQSDFYRKLSALRESSPELIHILSELKKSLRLQAASTGV